MDKSGVDIWCLMLEVDTVTVTVTAVDGVVVEGGASTTLCLHRVIVVQKYCWSVLMFIITIINL